MAAGAPQHSTKQHSTAPNSTAQHIVGQHQTANHSILQHSTKQQSNSTARAAQHRAKCSQCPVHNILFCSTVRCALWRAAIGSLSDHAAIGDVQHLVPHGGELPVQNGNHPRLPRAPGQGHQETKGHQGELTDFRAQDLGSRIEGPVLSGPACRVPRRRPSKTASNMGGSRGAIE